MQLNFNIEKLLDVVGGSTSLDPSLVLEKISSLEQATSNDIAIVFDPQEGSVFDGVSQKIIKNSKAAVLLASKNVVDGKNYIIVDDPLEAFGKLVRFISHHKENAPRDYSIHRTAYVSDTAIVQEGSRVEAQAVLEQGSIIGERTHVGSGSYIGKKCKIGSDVTIHPGVNILDGTIIGDHSIIHSGTVIGSDGFGYHVSRKGLRKIPQIGIVRIGKGVEIGANSCIDRAAFHETVIGDGVKIDNQVHIAHNVQVGPHTAIIAQTAIAGGVKIGAGCQIGGQVAIKDHVTIGNGVKIVSKSGVLRDIEDGAVVAGIPAVPFNTWKRIIVLLPHLPELFKMARTIQKKYTQKPWWKRLFGI
jgi:UDP-3-O-[3-hydroxymyristoyl] glucosamine N-acyltransferase